jgi:hypothetical protein
MRHEFKMTWVHDGQIYTRTNYHPCTSIRQVINALADDCILISVEDLTAGAMYPQTQNKIPAFSIKPTDKGIAFFNDLKQE